MNNDQINHPAHYTGKIECIEVIERLVRELGGCESDTRTALAPLAKLIEHVRWVLDAPQADDAKYAGDTTFGDVRAAARRFDELMGEGT